MRVQRRSRNKGDLPLRNHAHALRRRRPRPIERDDAGDRARPTAAARFSYAADVREREFLGDAITDWIRLHPEYEIFDKIVTQSSDAEFHCLAITVFYRTK